MPSYYATKTFIDGKTRYNKGDVFQGKSSDVQALLQSRLLETADGRTGDAEESRSDSVKGSLSLGLSGAADAGPPSSVVVGRGPRKSKQI